MLSYENIIAEVAEHLATHDSHGYSQPNRAGSGRIESIILSDGTLVSIHTGDYDCSEMVRTCVAAAGLIDWNYWASYMWTGNEDDVLRDAGFDRYSYANLHLKRGDILWMSGHTGVYLGNNLMADAHGDEYHGISGPNVGDQTGAEIEIRPVWSCSWTRVYRYSGDPRVGYNDEDASPYCNIVEVLEMSPTTVTFKGRYNIRDAASLTSNVVGVYDAGESVIIDRIVLAEGIFWGHYIGASSGADRYVCVGHLDAVKM